MNWDWLSFLVGAPIWASLGITFFAALARRGDPDVRRGDPRPEKGRSGRLRRRVERPGVISLSEYRLSKHRAPIRTGTSPVGSPR